VHSLGRYCDWLFSSSGVEHGAVSEPCPVLREFGDLFIALSNTGVIGAIEHVDNFVLLAPVAIAMRRLLSLCDSYARDICISFNAHKTKCMIVTPNKRRNSLSCLNLCIF
jgi:hypothetical protein